MAWNGKPGPHLAANLYFYTVLVGWTLAGLLLALPAWAVCAGILRKTSRETAHLFIRTYGRVFLALARPVLAVRCEGFAEHDIRPPCILAVNHASFFDVYALAALPVQRQTFLVKGWPFRMFWFAPFMRAAGYVNVEDSPPAQVLETARRVLAEGATLVAFPEGSRTRDGRLGRLRPGIFHLAAATGAPVVPVCLSGTFAFLPPGKLAIRPGRVHIRALAPVLPAEHPGPSGPLEVRKRVAAQLRDCLDELAAEPVAPQGWACHES